MTRRRFPLIRRLLLLIAVFVARTFAAPSNLAAF
jgi:hypothetical protein